jgi:hypothetical protein
MTQSLTRINQELTQTAEQFATRQAQFLNTYEQYLQALGQAMAQQLVLAVYQLCTRHYPQAFLALTMRDRTALQQSVQHLAQEYQAQLLTLPQTPYPTAKPRSASQRSDRLERLPISPEQLQRLKEKLLAKHLAERAKTEHEGDEDEDEAVVIAIGADLFDTMLNESAVEAEEANVASIEVEELDEAIAIADSVEATSATETEAASVAARPPATPNEFLRWFQHVEEQLQTALRELSLQANQQLQRRNILPPKLPSKLFQAAMQAESNGSGHLGTTPNTMSILIEGETDILDQDENSPLPLTAICLRLAEIELTATPAAGLRGQLREQIAQMKKLASQERKLRQLQACAEAESAWRAAWYEATAQTPSPDE